MISDKSNFKVKAQMLLWLKKQTVKDIIVKSKPLYWILNGRAPNIYLNKIHHNNLLIRPSWVLCRWEQTLPPQSFGSISVWEGKIEIENWNWEMKLWFKGLLSVGPSERVGKAEWKLNYNWIKIILSQGNIDTKSKVKKFESRDS